MASEDQWESWAQLDLCFSCLVLTSSLPLLCREETNKTLLSSAPTLLHFLNLDLEMTWYSLVLEMASWGVL